MSHHPIFFTPELLLVRTHSALSIVDPNRVDHTGGVTGGDEREDDEHESASLVKH